MQKILVIGALAAVTLAGAASAQPYDRRDDRRAPAPFDQRDNRDRPREYAPTPDGARSYQPLDRQAERITATVRNGLSHGLSRREARGFNDDLHAIRVDQRNALDRSGWRMTQRDYAMVSSRLDALESQVERALRR